MKPGAICARIQDRKEKTAKTVCTGRNQRLEKRNRTEIKDRKNTAGRTGAGRLNPDAVF